MNPSLLLGIVIGAAFVFLVLLAVVSISGRKPSKANLSFNEKSLDQLTERNAIGEKQMYAIQELVYGKRARRERIAVAFMAADIACDNTVADIKLANRALASADVLIAELDKPEPEPKP